jgi:ATP-binding cassette subfamily C protein CydD
LELLATLSTAVVAVEIGLRLLYGRFIFQHALFILILAPEFYMPLRQLGVSFHAGMEGINAAERIYSLLQIKPMQSPVMEKRVPYPIKEITFKKVSFAYQEGERPSLHGVDFSLNSGKRVALVGKSGSGKSTIASLMLGFIQPDSGEILVDGISLNQFNLNDWRQNISWVPQFPYVFHDTVEANLRIAKPNAAIEEIINACERAYLADEIETLPERYNTVVGERGAFLSGGQAQRMAIARAYLKDAPILILDEPASNLDPILEELLITSMHELMGNKTVLIIAHRLLTALSADHILVIKGGQVVEQGRHEELIKLQTHYHHLVTGDRD